MCYTMYRVARLWVPSQTGAIAGGRVLRPVHDDDVGLLV